MTRLAFSKSEIVIGAAIGASMLGLIILAKEQLKQKSWEDRIAEARAKAMWREGRPIGME